MATVLAMAALELVQWKSFVPPFAIMDVLESSRGLLRFLMSLGNEKDAKKDFFPAKNLFILLPGNPCMVECYRDFTAKLRDSCACDVLVLGYPGHTSKPHNGNRLFSLSDQIEVCSSFFRCLFSNPSEKSSTVDSCHESSLYCTNERNNVVNNYEGRIFLGGHSIGAYIGLQILSQYTTFIKLFFGLAPVLSRIKESPNGQNLKFMGISPVNWSVRTIGSVLCSLPRPALKLLTYSYAKSIKPDLREEILSTIHGSQIRNILYMLQHEFHLVRKPNWDLLRSLQEKMILYYIPGDNWAPLCHAEEIHNTCTNLQGYIMEEKSFNVSHAWCLADNDIVILHAITPYV